MKTMGTWLRYCHPLACPSGISYSCDLNCSHSGDAGGYIKQNTVKTLSHAGPSSDISARNFCPFHCTPLRWTKSTWPLLTCSHHIVITSKPSSQVGSEEQGHSSDRYALTGFLSPGTESKHPSSINRQHRSPGLLPIRRRDASWLEQKMKPDNFAAGTTSETLKNSTSVQVVTIRRP